MAQKGCRQKAVFQLFLLKKTERLGCKQQKQWKKGIRASEDKGFRSGSHMLKLTETQDKKRKGQFFCFAAAQRCNITQ